VHSEIRQLLASLFSPGVAEKVIIQYGGSVKPDGVSEILAKPNIDGALVGGASLKAESFTAIIEQAATIRK
ncbi:MAG: triose-phosphate isomerase, partial [Planctomycetota bacterium]